MIFDTSATRCTSDALAISTAWSPDIWVLCTAQVWHTVLFIVAMPPPPRVRVGRHLPHAPVWRTVLPRAAAAFPRRPIDTSAVCAVPVWLAALPPHCHRASSPAHHQQVVCTVPAWRTPATRVQFCRLASEEGYRIWGSVRWKKKKKKKKKERYREKKK
eukprot:NODE_2589_length_909_cov_274.317330.p1 GENE.NODE_2589_length_909_cov_274.317330~~NODE_2589_length_909_cov_274.317330.p1  ORF type:complete len:159 (+),score=32.26 NODE_2589_length_909_cov_274.317330:398-874(+)